MEELHELLRKWTLATSQADFWRSHYHATPSDGCAGQYARALQEMRAAMDAVVAHKLDPDEDVTLAE